MLDNPDKHGIFPTSTVAKNIIRRLIAYNRLEHYIESVRMEARIQAIGWCHANDCIAMDNGDDPRLMEIPKILEDALRDLDEK